MRSRRSLTAAVIWLSKSERIRRVVNVPTAIAKPQRITRVSTAEPTASRQRIGIHLSADDIPRASDRVQQPRLAAGLELAPQVGHEDLDRVGRRERVVTPHVVEQALPRD